MKRKSALGRGLDALLPTLEVREGEEVVQIPLDAVRPNPYQPRRTFDAQSLEELAASIREHGVLQPILVRPLAGGEAYEIVAGERRVRAARLAGLERIPAVLRSFDDATMMEVALIENVQREDLDPIEIARAYRALMERFSLTQDEVARKMGKSRSLVANYVRLLALPERVQEYVSRGTLSMGHAKMLAGLEDPRAIGELADRVVREGWSVRRLEEFLRKQRSESRRPARRRALEDRPSEYAALERELSEALGAPVRIRLSGAAGSVEIAFFDREDLERIAELLVGKGGTR
ncbi:MAG: Chromosome (plasmid) partitioning protein ParB [Brockia lithotrophica]|uniref:Chromosome (Plasmid) partitioning protein ParB n=1 Tax=Brockia lithotrophica TaxID=933949 RepID=A0A2T5GB19_9BACL|nr:ParB/RepB/Spo0J family partition protein [Brockia lithotrophica]MBT9252474.1 ParB/RepB/Spo0J family partition protein [Brockia lithotrophica]PTQ53389.1 MAG: Chromosome (plasmid) partitioning protein ParB [Brockia lithotrophica]